MLKLYIAVSVHFTHKHVAKYTYLVTFHKKKKKNENENVLFSMDIGIGKGSMVNGSQYQSGHIMAD